MQTNCVGTLPAEPKHWHPSRREDTKVAPDVVHRIGRNPGKASKSRVRVPEGRCDGLFFRLALFMRLPWGLAGFGARWRDRDIS